jgi:SAM-dependent methyltransferase
MATMWTGTQAYEQLMGRWSRRLAPRLVEFAGVRDGDRVLDLGCGTGSLTRVLLDEMPHSEVVGVDPAAAFIESARQQITDLRVRFEVGDAGSLPLPDNAFDRCLSLLVVNFIPDAMQATAEMSRVTRPGGTVAAAVWDYGEGMEMLSILWDTAVSLDPSAQPRHEANNPYCRRGELAGLWTESGFQQVEETELTIPLYFSSFDDYWTPFLAGVGPSGDYVAGLSAQRQQELQDHLRRRLSAESGEKPLTLQARAWAVCGRVPESQSENSIAHAE